MPGCELLENQEAHACVGGIERDGEAIEWLLVFAEQLDISQWLDGCIGIEEPDEGGLVADQHAEESFDGVAVEAVGLGIGDHPAPGGFTGLEAHLSVSPINA